MGSSIRMKIKMFIALGEPSTSSAPLDFEAVCPSSMSQIHDRLRDGIESRNEDSSSADRTLELPNIDAKPQKSILKNSEMVKHESRAIIVPNHMEGDVLSPYAFPFDNTNVIRFAKEKRII